MVILKLICLILGVNYLMEIIINIQTEQKTGKFYL